jgi:hypothetical protein
MWKWMAGLTIFQPYTTVGKFVSKTTYVFLANLACRGKIRGWYDEVRARLSCLEACG